MPDIKLYTENAISLLRDLIAIPSFSRDEAQTASRIESEFAKRNIESFRKGNNVWAFNKHFDKTKINILLNSHHDTVLPATGWRKDPFTPVIENGTLYGLGSNDAGASLVCLLWTFFHFHELTPSFNLIFLASAEEEISGENGVQSALPELPEIDLAIVGEPTQMNMAIAEKGLIVIDGIAKGKSGHAARNEGINAIYKCVEDIARLREFTFDKVSDLLGPTQLNITQIKGGKQHNVIPDQCEFVIDVRTNELYSNEEVFELLQSEVTSELIARSFRLNSSGIYKDHAIVKRGLSLGLKPFGSPTLSDQALMNFDSVKIGPGNSARSHTSDEFVELKEIRDGIATYISLLTDFTFE